MPEREYDSRAKLHVLSAPETTEAHATNRQLYRMNELGLLRNGMPITKKEAAYLIGRAVREGAKW